MERRTNDINQKSKDITGVGHIFLLKKKITLGKNSSSLMETYLSVRSCDFPWALTGDG